MSWLDKFFLGAVVRLQQAGTDLPVEAVINFASGATLADDPANGRTNITVAGGGGGSAVTSVFGRTGAVTAQTADYTAAQVGAVPTSRTWTAAGLVTGGGDGTANRTFTVTAGLNGDITDLGASASAGSSGRAADAAHVHPSSTTQTLRAGSTTSHSEQTGSVVTVSSGSTAARGFVGWQFSSDTFSSRLYLSKARGTEGSPAAVQSGDGILNIVCVGYDGTSWIEAARIQALVDNTVSAGVVPMSLNFYTGNSSSPTLRFSISSAGLFDFQASPIQGGAAVTTSVTTSPTSLTKSRTYYDVTTSSIAISLQLPDPTLGGEFVVTDVSGLAYTNNITFLQHGSETINGVAGSLVVTAPFGSWLIRSNGTNWIVRGPI